LQGDKRVSNIIFARTLICLDRLNF
jgi:hypothetical protein